MLNLQQSGGAIDQGTVDGLRITDTAKANLGSTRDPLGTDDVTLGYAPGSIWLNTTLNREWVCLANTATAAVWSFGGASYANSGYNPANEVTQFGGAPTALMSAEGNINRQVSSAGVSPGATAADNVLAFFSLPANALDGAAGSNRVLTITAWGKFAATGNNKDIKLFFNPATAVVGSTIGAGGTLLADTGVVATNAGGWLVSGNVIKYGAANSNTQLCTSNGAAAGGVHAGVSITALATATENAAILIAVTGNATTATTDIVFNVLEVNAMN
jgi:hypothetical protein